MKLKLVLSLAYATKAIASLDSPSRLLQLADGSKTWATPDTIHDLMVAGLNFMDITDHPESYVYPSYSTVHYPSEFTQNALFAELEKDIDVELLESHLTEFSEFHTRFCKAELGLNSSLWLADLINNTGKLSDIFSVKIFDHDLAQKSVIAQLKGSENPDKIIVLGAHLDSINLKDYFEGRAPGADDNGSGSVTILEVLRLLVLGNFRPKNTLEFHWYAAEEIGLIGSQDVFAQYYAEKKNVVAMFQQDTTGGTNRDRGIPDDFGVIEDFVDPHFTSFVKQVIDAYADIPWVPRTCGYACSDHASAYKYGYPSSFVIEYGSEAAIPDPGPRVGHNELDTVDRIDFQHMVQHVKLTLGVALELGAATFV